MFGKILTGILLISCVACAKPKYATVATDPQKATEDGSGDGTTATDCKIKFEKSGLCLEWSWEHQPGDSDFGILIFKTSRLVNGNLQAEDLSGTAALVLWMPSMGHGSSPTTVTRTAVGTYRATRVYFVMPGAWDLHFQNKSTDKVIDEAVISLILE